MSLHFETSSRSPYSDVSDATSTSKIADEQVTPVDSGYYSTFAPGNQSSTGQENDQAAGVPLITLFIVEN